MQWQQIRGKITLQQNLTKHYQENLQDKESRNIVKCINSALLNLYALNLTPFDEIIC